MLFAIGRDFFIGTDGLINDHIYPPDKKQIEYYLDNRIGDHGVRVQEWKSLGLNKAILKGKGSSVAPYININKDIFEMKFDGYLLNYGSTSLFNSKICNIYIVYKFDKPKISEWYEYPISHCLFGAIKVIKDKGGNYNKARYTGRGIALDPNGGYGMGKQGWGCNVVIFGIDNKNSLNAKNKNMTL